MTFYALIAKESEWYVATAVPSGVTSQGKTVKEAKRNLKEAVELYYEGEAIKPSPVSEPFLTPFEVNLAHG